MQPVTIYTTRTCQYCKKAKELLQSTYAVTPIEYQIDTDPALAREMVEKTGERSVPQIFIGDTHVGGFDALNALHTEGTLTARLAA